MVVYTVPFTPSPALLFILTAIVVAGGMLFARYGHILFHPP